MRGKYRVVVKNKRLHYEFEIKRNITIIKGDSATGKTTLINMIRQFANLGNSSGVDLMCDVPCRTLEGADWKIILRNISGNILFIDEENTFIRSEEFASEIKESDNYFVIITRENLYNLPYSVEEIYGLHSSGKYQNTKQIYQQMYRIYTDTAQIPVEPQTIVVEDSNSGYEFFKSIAEEQKISCRSAGGKTKLYSVLTVLAGTNSEEFIRNQKGKYFHESIVEFTTDEMIKIVKWINEAIADKEYMGGKELVDLIGRNLPDIHERYSFLTWLGLRDVLRYKLRDEFSFKGKIISAYGKELSMIKVFENFAKSHEYFTLDQLNTLKTELDTPIYFDAVYENSLRINKEEFVSKDKAKFDVTATDFAIEMFCTGDFVSIKDVNLFGGFPNAYFSWNAFLLQHYVANYSKKFKLLHAGFTANKPVGAIVKRNSSLDTFDDVVIRAVAESNVSLNSNSILEFLCASGYLARKSYGKMDELISQANLLRMNKGD